MSSPRQMFPPPMFGDAGGVPLAYCAWLQFIESLPSSYSLSFVPAIPSLRGLLSLFLLCCARRSPTAPPRLELRCFEGGSGGSP